MHMIQDLTNPGIALLQSIGLAAHIESSLAVEANARQYYPDTSSPEASVHPGVFMVREGQAETGTIRGNGLGYQIARIDRAIFQPSRLSR